jgi:thiol-disulfide isomerase/thioredoxin/Flp pilus assembly protein TadD
MYLLMTLRKPVASICARFLFSAALLVASAQTARPQSVDQNQAVEELLKQGDQALALQHYEDAAKAYKKANKLENDKCARCYLKLARSQGRLGDVKGALNSIEKALVVAPDDRMRAEGHVLRGDLLMAMPEAKRLNEAEDEYRKGLQLDTTVPEYHLKVAIALFKESRDPEGLTEVRTYLELAPAGNWAEYARKLQVNPRRARENYAPDFRLTTLQGQKIDSEELRGRVVVLDFWATWCPPCRESVPELKELTRKYPAEKLALISISADQDEERWRDYVTNKKMDWSQYWDKEGNMRKVLNVHAFPTYIIIDQDGVICERIVGMNPQETIVHRLKERLEAMLGKG